MSDLDRIETNFRLSLISQQETNLELRRLSSKVSALAHALAEGLGEVAVGLSTLAEKGDATAGRLEESIGVMKSFAEGQADMRKTLHECVRRLDALEDKAS